MKLFTSTDCILGGGGDRRNDEAMSYRYAPASTGLWLPKRPKIRANEAAGALERLDARDGRTCRESDAGNSGSYDRIRHTGFDFMEPRVEACLCDQ